MWWLNPPQADALDLETLVDVLSSGVKIEVSKDTSLVDDEGLSTYSIYGISLLDDIQPYIVQQYGLGTTNLEIFDRIAAKLPLGVDYVFFRDNQYTYSLVYGDLSYSGSRFTGSNCTRVDYYSYSGGGTQPTFTSSNIGSFNLNVGDWLVYSNLGNYPMLGGAEGALRYKILDYAVVGVLSFFLLLWRWCRLR